MIVSRNHRHWFFLVHFQPILPTAAVCVLCNKGDSASGLSDFHSVTGVAGGMTSRPADHQGVVVPCAVRAADHQAATGASKTVDHQAATGAGKTSDYHVGGGVSTTLMECGICWKIMHPSCLREKYPEVTNDGVINEDLPNSWECPKCCSSGRRGQLKVNIIKLIIYWRIELLIIISVVFNRFDCYQRSWL